MIINNNICGRWQPLRIAFGIAALVLLLVGGASAVTLNDPTGDWFTGDGNPATAYDYTDIISANIEQISSTDLKATIIVNANIPGFGWHGYRWFLDTDRSITTGQSYYLFNDIGADYWVQVSGNSGVPNPDVGVFKNGIGKVKTITNYVVQENKVEITFSLFDIGNPDSFYWIADATDGVSVNDHTPNSGHGTFPTSSPLIWTKYSNNPLTDLGSNVGTPSVIFDGITYKMWYSCEYGTGICYATSSDGITWTTLGKILSDEASGSWEDFISAPTVVFNGLGYEMWYSGYNPAEQFGRIGYATSPNGIAWTKYEGNPVLSPGGNGGWDNWNIGSPTVIRDGSTYKMWYDAQSFQYGTARIGYATSSDGISWAKYANNPVLVPGGNGGWDDRHAYIPNVIFEGVYRMWYNGETNSGIHTIGYAISSDGISWTKYSNNPVINIGNPGTWDDEDIFSKSVIFDGSTYKMWYTGYDGSIPMIGFASTSGATLDTDGDGLWDDWETNGIDTDGDGIIDIDLRALGANPNHKDIFLEIDWMENEDHSHRPKDAAIDLVIKAFADAPVLNPDGTTGINLHIDRSNAIPHQDVLNFEGLLGGDFDAVKAANFNPDRRLVYHYALFIHRQSILGSSSGRGELPGNDFYVSLGGWHEGQGDIDADGLQDEDVGTVLEQAGTLMHELGHNLNLGHGGNDDVNYKPNYFSVMNYWYQFMGIPSGIPVTFRLDYSRSSLSSLIESNLNEDIGIQDGIDIPLYSCPDRTDTFDSDGGAIDWDCDATLESSVSANINNPSALGFIPSPYSETLIGYNDWANIMLNFRASNDFADGVHETPLPVEEELDFPKASQIPKLLDVAIDIKPSSFPNSINLGSEGNVPVAILSSSTFDARTVNASTVTLAGAQVKRKGKGVSMANIEDANGDGLLDMVVHVNTEALQLTSTDIEAVLKGKTTDGMFIIGVDSVRIVPS